MTKSTSFLELLVDAVKKVEITTRNGKEAKEIDGVEVACRMLKDARTAGRKTILIGNGGSASIASHTAIDLSKNAHIAAMAFNDAAALTCLANDFGYDQVFTQQITYHALPDDVLVAISSSGESPNIVGAVATAKHIHPRIRTVTFSGFAPTNKLRGCGDLNFYVPSARYGTVELAHMVLLHSIIDKLVDEHWSLRTAECV